MSLPIPTLRRSHTRYDELGLGEIVKRLTRGRIAGDHLCHEDPMFADGYCAFGQTGAAQSHLARRGVGPGDVFLFFGLFAAENGDELQHRIFGYLKVDRVILLGAAPPSWHESRFPRQHPHTIGEWNANNTLYVGAGTTSQRSPDALRLTTQGGPLSTWHVPPWLREVGLTYHLRSERWLADDRLKAVARGQEFVADIQNHERAQDWLQGVMRAIEE